MMLKFKKDDHVKVVSGKDKGKEGVVKRVYPKKLTLIVEGANLYKKHVKSRQNQSGGIMSVERPLSFAKVTHLENGKAVRVGFKIQAGKKLRISKKTGDNL